MEKLVDLDENTVNSVEKIIGKVVEDNKQVKVGISDEIVEEDKLGNSGEEDIIEKIVEQKKVRKKLRCKCMRRLGRIY